MPSPFTAMLLQRCHGQETKKSGDGKIGIGFWWRAMIFEEGGD
jgi:hypothetical protein